MEIVSEDRKWQASFSLLKMPHGGVNLLDDALCPIIMQSMKRDMEIIRTILLNVEADKYQNGERINIPSVSDAVCGYHTALIFDAGLAEGRLLKTQEVIMGAMIYRLTSAGHDFCDGIRQDTIWNKVRKNILKPGASYGLSIAVEYVKILVRQQVFGDVPPG